MMGCMYECTASVAYLDIDSGYHLNIYKEPEAALEILQSYKTTWCTKDFIQDATIITRICVS